MKSNTCTLKKDDDLLLPVISKTDTHIDHTKTKAQQRIQFNLNKTTKNFSFDSNLFSEQDGNLMLDLANLKFYMFLFSIFQRNTWFEWNIPGKEDPLK